MKNNVFDKQKWGVLVQGPDSALAARSFSEAVKQCYRINGSLVRMIDRGEFEHEYSPIMWAQVDLWETICPGAKHEPDKTNWDEVC